MVEGLHFLLNILWNCGYDRGEQLTIQANRPLQ